MRFSSSTQGKASVERPLLVRQNACRGVFLILKYNRKHFVCGRDVLELDVLKLDLLDHLSDFPYDV